jgi:hypothetical protein
MSTHYQLIKLAPFARCSLLSLRELITELCHIPLKRACRLQIIKGNGRRKFNFEHDNKKMQKTNNGSFFYKVRKSHYIYTMNKNCFV